MFFKNKVGGTVGGLIFMIGLFILLYTLILPPCDKCELLGEDCSEVCKDKIYGEILLSENIGYVGEYSNSVDHNLDSADLFIKNEPSSSVLSNYLEIKHGLFGESDQVLEFSLDDMDNLNKLIYSENLKFIYLLLSILATLICYVVISIFTKAFKLSDINLKYK